MAFSFWKNNRHVYYILSTLIGEMKLLQMKNGVTHSHSNYMTTNVQFRKHLRYIGDSPIWSNIHLLYLSWNLVIVVTAISSVTDWQLFSWQIALNAAPCHKGVTMDSDFTQPNNLQLMPDLKVCTVHSNPWTLCKTYTTTVRTISNNAIIMFLIFHCWWKHKDW